MDYNTDTENKIDLLIEWILLISFILLVGGGAVLTWKIIIFG